MLLAVPVTAKRTGGRALEDAALVVGGQAAVQREQPDLREYDRAERASRSERPRPMGGCALASSHARTSDCRSWRQRWSASSSARISFVPGRKTCAATSARSALRAAL